MRQCVSSHRVVAVVKNSKVEQGERLAPEHEEEERRLDHVEITKQGSSKNIIFGYHLLTDIITDE